MSNGSDNASTLHMVYKLKLEQLPDRWVVKSDQFKSFAYGATQQEAQESFHKAVEMAVLSFTDLESLSAYLDATGIHWWFEEAEEAVSYQELGVSLAFA